MNFKRKKRIPEPPYEDFGKALSYMEEKQLEISAEQMYFWVTKLLKQPKIVPFLINKVEDMAPLEREKLDFPLRGLGEGYGAADYEPYDYADPRTLLLEAARLLNNRGQCKLFGLPGAEAYFMEVAKTGRMLTSYVQQRLLEQEYGKVVLKMYVYQGGRLCKEVREKYTIGDLLYGV